MKVDLTQMPRQAARRSFSWNLLGARRGNVHWLEPRSASMASLPVMPGVGPFV